MNFIPRVSGVRPVDGSVPTVALESSFDFAAPEYRELHANSGASVFQSPSWIDALHHEVAPAFGADQVTVTVRDPGGRLLMVLPLVRRRVRGMRILEFADFGLCDYNAPVYDLDEAVLLDADMTLPQRVAAVLPPHDLVALIKMTREDSLLRRLLPGVACAQMRYSAFPARLGADWAAWRDATLSQGFRRELGMKRRRLERLGAVEFRTLNDPQKIGDAFETLRRLRSARLKSLGAANVMDNEVIFAFYRRMAIEGAREGFARTECIYLAGEAIAVQFGLVQRGTYSMLMLGAEIERLKRISPGMLMVDASLRAAIEGGDQMYDFTIGDHPYKEQFGARALPLYEWHRANTLRGHAGTLAIEVVREAKRVLKPLLKPVRGYRTRRAPDNEGPNPQHA